MRERSRGTGTNAMLLVGDVLLLGQEEGKMQRRATGWRRAGGDEGREQTGAGLCGLEGSFFRPRRRHGDANEALFERSGLRGDTSRRKRERPMLRLI